MTSRNWAPFWGSFLLFVFCIPNSGLFWVSPLLFSFSHSYKLSHLLNSQQKSLLVFAEHLRGVKSLCMTGMSCPDIVILLSCLGVCEDHYLFFTESSSAGWEDNRVCISKKPRKNTPCLYLYMANLGTDSGMKTGRQHGNKFKEKKGQNWRKRRGTGRKYIFEGRHYL